MKKNSFLFLVWGVFFCACFYAGHLHAQTSYSDQSDLAAVDDKELAARLKGETPKPAPVEEESTGPEIVTGSAAVEKAQSKKAPKAKPLPNLFAKNFYAAPSKKAETIATDVQGFTVMHTPSRKMGAEYAVITDFGGEVVKTRFLKDLKTIDDVNDYIQSNMETSEDGSVEIRKLKLPGEDGATLYWVGDKAFESPEAAKQKISTVREDVKKIGGNFDEMVSEAQVPLEIEDQYVTQLDRQYISNQKKEEDMLIKWADQLDLGEQLWGPFHGDAVGEPLLWQSFGETSYRSTNLEDNKFNSQVGFWTNRLVFKGIRFPLNTIDPFIETTVSMEAVPEDFKSYVDYFAGVEWRPLARNHWLMNYRPLGNIKILEWVRNYRLYFKYGNRYNIKDEIAAHDWDYKTGIQIFYEFGVELPDLNKPAPETFPEYLEEYVWGEYFSDNYYSRTDFSTDKNNRGWSMGNSLLLGIKMPGIPLPDNPINNEVMLMPYLRLNHTYSSTHDFHFQNYYFVSAGVRWMPFRTWRHKENEWLSKLKIFGEWIAIGKTQHYRQDSTETGPFVRNDLRFGLSFASRRY